MIAFIQSLMIKAVPVLPPVPVLDSKIDEYESV